MIKDIIVIDDIISSELQDEIKNTLLGYNFPWYFVSDVTFDSRSEENLKRPAFAHDFILDNKINSNYAEMVLPIIRNATQAINFKYNFIIRSKAFLQLPLSNIVGEKADPLHVDIFSDHLVIIYYVCNSQARTIITDKKYDPLEIKKHNLKASDFNIIKTVEPKQGRVVIFDGLLYHTGEQPHKGIRSLINFNLD